MKKVKTSNDVTNSKQTIDKELQQMERDLMKSSNPLDQLMVLNRAEDILDAEIYHWTQLMEDNIDCTEEELQNVISSAAPHIALLMELIETIKKYRIPLLDGAKQVYQARINSHQKVGKIKHLS